MNAAKNGTKDYARIRLALNVYIAILVTVLGGLILSNVGTNNAQNRKIAEQAKALALSNTEAAREGCHRGNFVRTKINTISGALTELLKRSVAENEAQGRPLTSDQEAFLDKLYGRLAPLKLIDCGSKYPLPKQSD